MALLNSEHKSQFTFNYSLSWIFHMNKQATMFLKKDVLNWTFCVGTFSNICTLWWEVSCCRWFLLLFLKGHKSPEVWLYSWLYNFLDFSWTFNRIKIWAHAMSIKKVVEGVWGFFLVTLCFGSLSCWRTQELQIRLNSDTRPYFFIPRCFGSHRDSFANFCRRSWFPAQKLQSSTKKPNQFIPLFPDSYSLTFSFWLQYLLVVLKYIRGRHSVELKYCHLTCWEASTLRQHKMCSNKTKLVYWPKEGA